jgi:hypothetical protein
MIAANVVSAIRSNQTAGANLTHSVASLFERAYCGYTIKPSYGFFGATDAT